MKATIGTLAVIIHCVLSQQFTYITVPDTEDGTGYVFADEGTANVSIFCQEFVDGSRVITPWGVRLASDSSFTTIAIDDNEITAPDTVIGDIIITGDISGSETFQSNLTIVNFTAEYDRAMFRCGSQISPDRRIIDVGFPILPSVADVGTQQQIEGASFTVDLTAVGANDPFPPTVTSQWYFNGVAINDSDGITLTDYTISFTNAMRDRAGIYTLTVSNDAGNGSNSFILDILYGPEASPVGGSFTKSPGSTFTLTAFVNITGNPQPNASWTGPSGPIVTGDRLDVSVLGQLTINDTIASDNGTYTCTISNGIGVSLVETIELTVAVRPGPPTNLTATNVTDASVILTWLAPLEVGIPPLSLYRITIQSSISPDIVLETEADETILYVEDELLSGTQYNATVIGVSTDGDNFDMLLGERSDAVFFETATGAPTIESAVLIITDTVNVSWALTHDGGLDIDEIIINCTNNIIIDVMCEHPECDSSNRIVSEMVIAGVEYVCDVTAINDNGTDTRRTNAITPSQGLPSVPMIVNIDVNEGLVILELRTQTSGTTGTLTFVVSVTNVDDDTTSTYNFMYNDYVDGSIVQAPIRSLDDGGNYMFSVVSRNEFGNSLASDVSDTVSVPPAAQQSSIGTPSLTTTTSTISQQPTSTSLTGTSRPSTDGGISGGAIAGIIIALIVVLVILALVIIIVGYLVYKNRGGTYQVERTSGGKGGVKVEELHNIDIGTELQEQSTEEKYTNAPSGKAELQYADLEHFAKKEPPSEKTMPAPVQEVQYSEIQGTKQ